MATNIYGKCTGTSSTKYDLWANVSQSDINIPDNTSKITIKIYLKRNDGNSSSAYNLYESSNSVTLKINGVSKVSKNLAIDTRNGATVLLASYSETISHSADGTLKLNVNSSFTMGNTTLSGGSVSGEYKGTSIPRTSEMTFSATTINPGDTVEFTVSSSSSVFSHEVLWSLGNRQQKLILKSGVLSSSFTVPKEWASAVTTSSSATLSVSLTTLNGNVTVGTRKYDVKFLIPATEEYKPGFNISITKDNGNIPATFDYYIKGISLVTVEPEGLAFSYGATLAAVTITLGDVSIRKLPATFNLKSAGDTLVTVAVRDTRGMLTVKTQTINVLDYEKPSVEIMSLERCNSAGVRENLGTYASLNYRVGYSSLDGNNQPVISLKYRKSTEEAFTYVDEVTDSPFVFGDGGLAVGSSYIVCLTVSDSICSEANTVEAYISGGDIPFNIRKGGRGASFGKFSEKDSLLDVGWDMRVSGNVEIGGSLNSENVGCSCSDKTTSMMCFSKYFPWLNMVFLRLRVDTLQELSANSSHVVAVLENRLPGVFTPLSVVSDYGSMSHSSGGVMYGTGNIVVWSDKAIPQGTKIYISGYYIVN